MIDSTEKANTMEIRLENQLTEIQRLAEIVEAFGLTHHLPPTVVFKLNLALDEVLTNVIEYGYEDGARHEILVVLALTDGMMTAEVVDDGRPYDPTRTPEPDLTLSLEERPIGGLGIYFARRMMDRVEYRRDGSLNRLCLTRQISSDQTSAGSELN